MKVLVCGSRTWDRSDFVAERLGQLPPGAVVVHGKCPKGADLHAALHCTALGIKQLPYPANWKRDGRKAAGPIRNRRMLNENPDIALVIAFWDGASTGTKDMTDEASKRGIPVEVWIRHEDGIARTLSGTCAACDCQQPCADHTPDQFAAAGVLF